jgi:hypothetical protein
MGVNTFVSSLRDGHRLGMFGSQEGVTGIWTTLCTDQILKFDPSRSLRWSNQAESDGATCSTQISEFINIITARSAWEIMNYQTTEWIFSRQIFLTNLTIRHWWQYHFPQLFLKKKVFFKRLPLKIDIAAHTGGQWKHTKYVSYPWPRMVAALWISTFCFLHVQESFFLIYTLLMVRLTPKEINQHQHH